MGRMYAGNPPADGEGWIQVGKCLDGDEVEWLVFSKSQKHTPDWLTYKIVADGRARNKANYWLVRNASTGPKISSQSTFTPSGTPVRTVGW